MERLTRVKDEYECRIGECFAEEWMNDHYNKYTYDNVCEDCPFIKIVNKLAEYEDLVDKVDEDKESE